MIFPDHQLADYVEHFRQRVLQDALAEATRDYWLRRAADFEAALPREGDFVPAGVDLERRRLEIAAALLACRKRAAVSMIGGEAA